MEIEADRLIQRGYDLCFGGDERDIERGRQMLLRAAESGRIDAFVFLGESYELMKDFVKAAEYYEKGAEENFRLAMFRFALMHRGRKLKDHDRAIYLGMIRKLAIEGHAPSLSLYMKERVRGSFGFREAIKGIVMFIPDFLRLVRIVHSDPNGPMMQK